MPLHPPLLSYDEYIGLRLRRNRGGLTVPRGGRPSGPGRVKKKTVLGMHHGQPRTGRHQQIQMLVHQRPMHQILSTSRVSTLMTPM